MNDVIIFNDNWEFTKTEIDTEYSDSLDWKHVDIPHDWLIFDTDNLYETSRGWYRKSFTYINEQRRVSICFDGVYMDSKVYVNGKLAGEWKYGYSAFEFDITELLREGENLIAVSVDHRAPNSRWYSGAGIFRNVHLKMYNQTHIPSNGIYISASADGSLTVTTEVVSPENKPVQNLSVLHKVLDNGKILCEYSYDCTKVEETCNIKLEGVIPWDIENPYLYILETTLFDNGEAVHTENTRFGFRTIEFTTDKGFFLNGKHVKLHGACEHHDLGSLGAAFNKHAMRRKLVKFREIGINAIRTSHNMPAKELCELADEMGYLILSEAFDMWEKPKTTYDYARFFPEWVDKDVASWVRRDRNHPCVIGWSIGNEIYDTHASERGQEVTSLLTSLVKQHDPRGNGYVTIGSNYMPWENAQKCADIVKLAGYNYNERLYNEHHKEHPDWMIYGSETSSVVQSRGIYHFPFEKDILSEDDEQCSALGNSRPGFAAKSTETCIADDRDAQFCAGQFIWTGFDYIGEPTPYSTKNSYFGQYDTAGFAKDSAYIFRAEWTDYKKSPFVHVYPYWDFTEGQIIDVRVVSNAPCVELFLNGKSVGRKNIDHINGRDLSLDVKLPYEKGVLSAVAYDENENVIARDEKRSFTDTASITLTPDKTTMSADGEDLIFVEISALDKDSNPVWNANNRVFVSVTGAGRLVGLDNGDSTDYDNYKTTSRRMFSGKLLAIVAAKKQAGEIVVKASSPSLPDAQITLEAVSTDKDISGISAVTENHSYGEGYENDIPVRKIEIHSDSRHFTKDNDTITFTAVCYPENAVYKNDIDFRLTTAAGIDTNLAKIVSREGNSITVKCLGDGEFYVRALCKNGTDKYHILSAVEVSADGIGSATMNPYELVAGGLCTRSNNVANGIQRGVGFLGKGSWATFDNVDFGKIGSDTVTVPIFANCTNAVDVRFYDGTYKDGELIGDFSYQEKSIWLTYIPNTYKLTKKLTGVHTITVASDNRYDLKGFVFDKPSKETSEISALMNDNIYGDSFTIAEDAVTGIGNNVVLDFGEFDFTDKVPKAIAVTGRSSLELNSIHAVFVSDSEKRVLLEFEKSESFTERQFELDGISGKCRVSFMFLPGSNFDFKSFRFIF
ncbi:MAG: DUF4982 domain-containing protein [Oscillospiraceae bacterium]|nr:DUF4982 domain-containing protein [Oscillospiraceae bacterium]